MIRRPRKWRRRVSMRRRRRDRFGLASWFLSTKSSGRLRTAHGVQELRPRDRQIQRGLDELRGRSGQRDLRVAELDQAAEAFLVARIGEAQALPGIDLGFPGGGLFGLR